MERASASSCLADAARSGLSLRSSNLLSIIPTDKSPAALEDRARDFLARIGAPPGCRHRRPASTRTATTCVGWRKEDHSPTRWQHPRHGRSAGRLVLVPDEPAAPDRPRLRRRSALERPAALVSGMAGAGYDLQGRLLSFYVVPPQQEETTGVTPPEADFAPLFAEARLDPQHFRPVSSRRHPPVLRRLARRLRGALARTARDPTCASRWPPTAAGPSGSSS